MRVLVPYNGSRAARAALDEVIRKPWPAGTRVRIVALVESYPFVGGSESARISGSMPEETDPGLELAEHHVQTALKRLSRRPDLFLSAEMRGGSLIDAVMAAMADWQPDQVVVCSKTKSLSWKRLCVALATRASCEVGFARAPLAA